MAEKELEEMSQEVNNELSIQQPITFQSYDNGRDIAGNFQNFR